MPITKLPLISAVPAYVYGIRLLQSATLAPAGPDLNELNVWVCLAGLAAWRRRREGAGISGRTVLDKGWAR